MQPIYNKLKIRQGATFQQTFVFKQMDGVPVDLTGYGIRSQIRKTPSSTTKVIDISASIPAPLEGKIELSLTDTQTTALPAGVYVYDVELYVIGGNVERVLEGAITVTPEVTR